MVLKNFHPQGTTSAERIFVTQLNQADQRQQSKNSSQDPTRRSYIQELRQKKIQSRTVKKPEDTTCGVEDKQPDH